MLVTLWLLIYVTNDVPPVSLAVRPPAVWLWQWFLLSVFGATDESNAHTCNQPFNYTCLGVRPHTS